MAMVTGTVTDTQTGLAAYKTIKFYKGTVWVADAQTDGNGVYALYLAAGMNYYVWNSSHGAPLQVSPFNVPTVTLTKHIEGTPVDWKP
jgi:hypothetical protein